MTLVIGLTGSIGTGKSTVAKMFKQLGIPVIDADEIARLVVEPGKEAYEKIVETFGEDILQKDRTLDRKKLGAIVFNDEEKRKQLNGIVHPAIRKEMLRQRDKYLQQHVPCVVLDIPLLYESKLEHFVDKVIVVKTSPVVQLERILARDDLSKEEALKRINAQIDVAKKAEWADAVIDNDGTIEETERQLKDILTRWHILTDE